jgi:1-aminocyclopropane-1-carboxylate deaminase/D-cysteine desulfhydrase-like pyridoxal-dependent ACC family enzyme
MVDAGNRVPFTLPLLLRHPALAWLPRVRLGTFPTPVERVATPAGELWIKRDDLSGASLGGNKVRALEYLLAGVKAGDEVLTVGARGSTHALATAIHGRNLGARVTVVRWPQEMNADAAAIALRTGRTATRVLDARTAVDAMLRAMYIRLKHRPRWVPAGGTSALGALGHVNAAFELAEQVAAGRMPAPARIVVPLGTGGTSAGLALGLAMAGLDTTLLCASVAPRIVANKMHVLRVAHSCARLIERSTGVRIARPDPRRIVVERGEFGGAYGRETERGREAVRWMRATHGLTLDATYSAKALAAALNVPAPGPTLFWLTYDARAARDDESISS